MFEDEAVAAIKALDKAGSTAFITGESCGPEGRYEVVCKFKTLQESQAFYRALIQCGEAARVIEAEEQASSSR